MQPHPSAPGEDRARRHPLAPALGSGDVLTARQLLQEKPSGAFPLFPVNLLPGSKSPWVFSGLC